MEFVTATSASARSARGKGYPLNFEEPPFRRCSAHRATSGVIMTLSLGNRCSAQERSMANEPWLCNDMTCSDFQCCVYWVASSFSHILLSGLKSCFPRSRPVELLTGILPGEKLQKSFQCFEMPDHNRKWTHFGMFVWQQVILPGDTKFPTLTSSRLAGILMEGLPYIKERWVCSNCNFVACLTGCKGVWTWFRKDFLTSA